MKPRATVYFLLLSLWLSLATAGSALAYPAGKSSFRYEATYDKTLEVLVYQPKNFGPNSPIQFVMHGVSRNADQTLKNWIGVADRYGVLMVAPKFSKHLYKHGTDYTLGGENFSKVSNMTISVVEQLFDRVKKDTGNQSTTYRIYGHSAGGQFVHRLMLLLPENRAEWAVTANAGWYTLPEWRPGSNLPGMPYSMKNLPDAENKVRRALARKLVVMLGDMDTDPYHMQLQHGAEVDLQGLNRFDRGKNFFVTAESAAKALNTKFAWELKIVPGVAHDGAKMAEAAADLMYGHAK